MKISTIWNLLLTIGGVAIGIQAEEIEVPNASFESPRTSFVSLNIGHWQKLSKPDEYVESGGFLWDQLVGIFKNTPVGQPDHLENCHGDQALWLFAVPGVGLFQDGGTRGSNDAELSGTFDARFEAGRSYSLTVGVNGGGGGMLEGVTLEISLYFRDDDDRFVAVAATTITNTLENFPNRTRFFDYEVHVPAVRESDPWNGRPIGIRFLSTVAPDREGGYWDLDHVRLASRLPPRLSDPRFAAGEIAFTIEGEPGRVIEISGSPTVSNAVNAWTPVSIVTNATGSTVFSLPAGENQARFFRARQLPE